MPKLNYLKRFHLTLRLVVTPRKPLAFLAALRNYLKARVSDKPVLRGVDIVTNYSCNLFCKHCNIKTMSKKGKKKLTLKDYEKIEKQCTDLGVFQYCFTGGEPLLNKDFGKIVKIFKPYKRIMLIQTNGQLIDSFPKVKWLKKVGIDIVNVSLDSGIAEEHDASRGVKGQHAHTLKVIRWCQRAGLGIIIGTVISHQNLHAEGMKRLIDYASKNNLILLLNLAVPVGRWYDNRKILLNKKDQAYVRQLVKDYSALRLDMDSTINQYGCPALKEKLYVTPFGDVTGCTFVPISFGNVREKSLAEIRKVALKTGLMSRYANTCYAAENGAFIEKYMLKLDRNLPRYYKAVVE